MGRKPPPLGRFWAILTIKLELLKSLQSKGLNNANLSLETKTKFLNSTLKTEYIGFCSELFEQVKYSNAKDSLDFDLKPYWGTTRNGVLETVLKSLRIKL